MVGLILIFVVALAALLIDQHGMKSSKCACAEIAGDNPDCPVRAHRNLARTYERIGRQSGH